MFLYHLNANFLKILNSMSEDSFHFSFSKTIKAQPSFVQNTMDLFSEGGNFVLDPRFIKSIKIGIWIKYLGINFVPSLKKLIQLHDIEITRVKLLIETNYRIMKLHV